MTVRTGQIEVGTTPVRLFKANADGASIVLHNDNNASKPAWIGGNASVTIDNGYHLAATDITLTFHLLAQEELWAVTAAQGGTVLVSFIADD